MAALFEIPHTWEEPDGLFELLTAIREQRPDADLKKIRYAFFLAEEAHSGQTRGSGDAYISHPLAVASILVDLRMDDDSICAALLHDTLEDCEGVTFERLSQTFGPTVAELVEGVTKLKFNAPEVGSERARKIAETHRAAESLRKMLLAMARDVRVMIIKLADRMHNMRTLDGVPPEKRIRIASETLDVFAPLAARLGIWQVKWQLEDLAFKHLHPREYLEIQNLVAKSRADRERMLSEAIVMLKDRLRVHNVKLREVQGRPKHLYSIFNKIVRHGFKFEEILDLIAMRVIVEDKIDCYLALSVVNELWVPLPQHFYDYIARPKPNGYQSLHMKVIGPHGEPLEIQIRTEEMHQVAEMGIAAHYAYKEGANGVDQRFSQLRQQLFDWSSDYRTSSDFLRSLSTDLFSEQVFVFTPKGDVLDLPKDSTPVDFAFRVHSNLGLRMIGARVNGKIVPLSHRLQNGDVVEVQTRSNAQPSFDWLEFVQSPSARTKLRSYFRGRLRSESIARGRDALERELRSLGHDPKEFLGEERLGSIAHQIKDCTCAEDVFAKVGEGLASVQNVVSKLRGLVPKAPPKEGRTPKPKATDVMRISGALDKISLRRAKCCDPIPGEEVVGYVTRGRGIMIHRKVCSNALAYLQSDPERLVPLEWPPDGSVYSVALKIVTLNRQGLLADLANVLGETKTNVISMSVKTMPNNTAELDVGVEVQTQEHLNLLMVKLSNFTDVFSVLRLHGRTGSR